MNEKRSPIVKMCIRDRAWTEDEEARLKDEFEREVPMEGILKRHHRNYGGIKARLKKLGLIE